MTSAIHNDELIEQGWAALPTSYRIPDTPPTLAEAQAYCKALAESQTQNCETGAPPAP